MSRRTVRLAILLIVGVILVSACAGRPGPPFTAIPTSRNFNRTVGEIRSVSFRNETVAALTINTAAIIGTTGFLGENPSSCNPNTIAGGLSCIMTIRLTGNAAENGSIVIQNGNQRLGSATLIH